MQFLEGIRLAMVQIVTEKLKSLFSLLGVIIGVMFLIVVVSVVEGMDRYIREDFSSQIFGVNTVSLRRNTSVQIGPPTAEERRERARRPLIYQEDAEAIRERLTIPARVGVQSDFGSTLVADNGRSASGAEVVAVSPEMLVIRDWVVERGRAFTALESERGVPVVILGTEAAEVLYPGLDPVGRTVRIRGFPYRIVGILEERGSLFGQSLDNIVVAPIGSPIRSLVSPRGQVEEVVIQAVDPSRVRDIQIEVEGIMRVRHQLRPTQPNDFAAETADESLSIWDTISTVLFTALPALVAISLVVGGIVIMNIMLVSVMERTREIGVRKAIGARRRDIVTQVLIESATLSTVGSLVGVGIGVLLTGAVRALSPLPAAVAPEWVSLGVGLGITVGIVAGVYPAARASRLDPVDALRYE